MRGVSLLVLVILLSAVPTGRSQSTDGQDSRQPTTFLGALFSGQLFNGGLLSQFASGSGLVGGAFREATGQSTANTGAAEETTPDNLSFLACTQSTACFNDSTQTPGAWTCRPQVVGRVSLCVPTLLGMTLGREGDSCGCCDGVCPQKCDCECTTATGVQGYMARFNFLFGLVQFDQCLEPTVADAAISFNTLDITCSDVCHHDDDAVTVVMRSNQP